MSATPSLGENAGVETTSLFVYGGLMRGFDLHHYLAGCTFLVDAWTSGILVRAGRYPGLVDGAGKVAGELYAMGDAPALLEVLDELEEYDPLHAQASLYVRSVRLVSKGDKSTTSAWVYIYNRETRGLPIITSGDWRSAAK